MKIFNHKYLYLLVLPLLSFFISCSSDDENEIGTEEDLVGTWTLDDASLEFLIDDMDFIQWLVDNLELTSAQADEFEDIFAESYTDGFNGTLTFNEDGTYTANLDDESETGTWAFSGTTLTLNPDVTSDTPSELTVLTLTSSALVIEFSETEDVDLEQDGTNETLSISFQLSFSK